MRWSASLKGHPGEGEWKHWRVRSSGPWALPLGLCLECAGISRRACCVFSGLRRRLLAFLIHISAPLSHPTLAPHRGAGSVVPGPRASGRKPAPHRRPGLPIGVALFSAQPFSLGKMSSPTCALGEYPS